jgi:hypothetical protein
MLDVFAVFRHDSRTKFGKTLAKLWEDLGANQVLNRLFAAVIGVDIYFKLVTCQRTARAFQKRKGCERREHTTYSSSSVSWATSGTVIVPLASSPS